MSGKDGLEFHDSGGDDVLFDQGAGHTHTFTNFPDSAIDMIDDDEETEDKSQLLKDESSKRAPSFWSFEYYQQFFDVETTQVFHRVAGSMLPLPKRNYLNIHIRPNPDLYGPFWICTTLVFTTAIAGNLANYLSSGGKDYKWRYDFNKVTFAATAIFSYWWMIPAVMYGFLWWRKSQAGFTFLEILCVYGYSLAIYIPISILWVINITWFKWVLVIIGAVLSGGVLVITFWPAVKEETKNVAAIFLGLIFLFHLGLAAGFVLYFFHVPPPATAAITTTTAPTKVPEKLQQIVHAGAPAALGSLKTDAKVTESYPKTGDKVTKGAGAEGVLRDNIVGSNTVGGSAVNKDKTPVKPGDKGPEPVANPRGGVNTSEQGSVHKLQKQAGDKDDERVRNKLDTAEQKTNFEARDENTNMGDRKVGSNLEPRKKRKVLKDRKLG